MNRSLHRFLLLALALTLLALATGCLAVGQSFKLAEVMAMLVASGSYTILIATRDRREYVARGSKRPDFVGVLKGGFGNPFDVKNFGGKAFSDTFSDVVAKSLKAKGYTPNTVVVTPQDTPEQVRQKLLANPADRNIFIDVEEWKSESMTRTAMNYKLTLTVMDNGGNVVAKSAIEGRDVLGGSAFNPAGVAKKRVPVAFKEHIERLLNDDAVVAALK
jgi:hypothetical protein